MTSNRSNVFPMERMSSGTYPSAGFKPQLHPEVQMTSGFTNRAYSEESQYRITQPRNNSTHLSESSTDIGFDETIPADPVSGVVRASTLPHPQKQITGILKGSSSTLPKNNTSHLDQENNNKETSALNGHAKTVVLNEVNDLNFSKNTDIQLSNKSVKKVSFSALSLPEATESRSDSIYQDVDSVDLDQVRVGSFHESPFAANYSINTPQSGYNIHVDEYDVRSRRYRSGSGTSYNQTDEQTTSQLSARELKMALVAALMLVGVAITGLIVLATLYGLRYSSSTSSIDDVISKSDELGLEPVPADQEVLFKDPLSLLPLYSVKDERLVTYAMSSDAYVTWVRPSHESCWVWQKGAPIQVVSLDASGMFTTRYLGDALSRDNTLFRVALGNNSWHAARVMNTDTYSILHVFSEKGFSPILFDSYIEKN